MKRTNGITLIALIITIIVLLILAGVALNSIFGEWNILENANKIVEKYNNNVAKENEMLNEIYLELIERTQGLGGEISIVLNTYNWTNENVTATISSSVNRNLQYKIDDGEWIDGTTVTVQENCTIYARATDGENNSGIKSIKISNIDKIKPNATISLSEITFGVNATINSEDTGGSGVDFSRSKYVLTNNEISLGEDESLYTEGNISEAITEIKKAKKAGTYYLHGLIVDKAGNKQEVISNNSIQVANSIDYDYTGAEQSVNLIPGIYKLECWGAQGGKNGGYGGYSKGCIQLAEEAILYVNVGGVGNTNGTNAYNGGGKGNGGNYAGDGGGATHIAKLPGILSTLKDSIEDIIIVAGGGGGTSETGNIGGSGGGYLGNAGSGNYRGGGATQTEGGTKGTGTAEVGSFGQGGNAELLYPNESERFWAGGGGGGYYGGGGAGWSTTRSYASGGGGGSGYIGNTLLFDKLMYGYSVQESTDTETKTVSTTNVADIATENYAKSGNGYAKITNLNEL